jgi:hypothetical protein
MALSGDEIILNRKHTTRLNVAAGLTSAFDRDKDGALVLQRNIEGLEDGPLSLGDGHRKLFEICYRRLLPTRMLIPVTDSYLFKEDHTDWGFTELFFAPHIVSNHYIDSEAGSSMRIIHEVHENNSFHFLSIISYVSHRAVGRSDRILQNMGARQNPRR